MQNLSISILIIVVMQKMRNEIDGTQNESTRDYSNSKNIQNNIDINESYDYDKNINFDKNKYEITKRRGVLNFSNRNQQLPKVHDIRQYVRRSPNKTHTVKCLIFFI